MEEMIYNVLEAVVVISYQQFKKVRNAIKMVRNISIVVNLILFAISWEYNSHFSLQDLPEPEIDMWFISLTNAQAFEVLAIMFICLIAMYSYHCMNRGKNVKLSYKAWCEWWGYEPYNSSKH